MTAILLFILGACVGAVIMGVLVAGTYDRGYEDGQEFGYLKGKKEGLHKGELNGIALITKDYMKKETKQ